MGLGGEYYVVNVNVGGSFAGTGRR